MWTLAMSNKPWYLYAFDAQDIIYDDISFSIPILIVINLGKNYYHFITIDKYEHCLFT